MAADSQSTLEINLLAWFRTNRQRIKLPPSMSFYLGCHRTVLPVSRMGCPISNNKVHHRRSQKRGHSLIPVAVTLTTQLSHHTRNWKIRNNRFKEDTSETVVIQAPNNSNANESRFMETWCHKETNI